MVSHQYSPLDDPTKTITSVKVGETVRVKVTVIAPAERNHVIFVAPAHAEETFPEVLGRSDSGRFRGWLRLWSCARAMMSAKRSACRFGILV